MTDARPQELAFVDSDLRRIPPEPTAQRPFKFPAVAQFTLPQGIAVYLVENHALPIATMQLELDGGTLADPAGKAGLASVSMAMLVEGTAQLDKLAYAERLANIASSITAGAGDDTLSISLSSLTEHLDETFALFVATLRTPGLRARDFDRMIERRVASLQQARSSPAQIPNRLADPILYGLDHPRGAVITEASYRALTLEDCRAFLATQLRPEHARLFVVGDLTESQIRARFAALDAWTGRAPAIPPLPPPSTMPGRIFFVDVPGAVQSQVWQLAFGPARTAPEYFDTAILAAVFGGGFASRLNMNLREAKGYSYGARGGFHYTRTDGTFVASTQVRADATAATVGELARELRELATGERPATAAEIEREKIGATLALPGRFATAPAALGQYRGLVYFGLPLDYFDRYLAQIESVTPERVARAAAIALDPDRTIYLVVGDGATKQLGVEAHTLRAALAELGGFVELDADARHV